MVPSPWRDKPASLRSMRCLWTVFLTLLVTSSVLATELTGPIVGVLDGDTIEVLNGHHVDRIRLSGIDCPERGLTARRPSTPPLNSPSGNKSGSRHTASTSMGAPLPMCSCPMG